LHLEAKHGQQREQLARAKLGSAATFEARQGLLSDARLKRHHALLEAQLATLCSYRLCAARRYAKTAFKSCLSKSISNGFSIRGLFEMASFRPGNSVATEPEHLSSPVFEVYHSVSESEFLR